MFVNPVIAIIRYYKVISRIRDPPVIGAPCRNAESPESRPKMLGNAKKMHWIKKK
jgi:hypothetical protein